MSEQIFRKFFRRSLHIIFIVRADADDADVIESLVDDKAVDCRQLRQIGFGRGLNFDFRRNFDFVFVPAFDRDRAVRRAGDGNRSADAEFDGIGFISRAFD